ncbi:MAG TPA: hypothetical protein VJ951_13335, partial [Bacteroidales bacterium]|nr:hypothetical protein [Bacteroidales bacterium]
MKQLFFSIIVCVLLCFFNFSAISQPYSTNVQGSITPSVSAMSYGKYADSPIDPATGTMGASIPLYNLSDGTLSHAVSLSYHTGGIRVSELSSEVGLGWHLNTGGVISRTVRGLPDDHEDGYWNKAQNISTDSTGIGDIADGDIDGEPDLFFYNIGGMIGKFIIDENQNIHTIPKSDIKIEIYHQGAPNLYQGFLGFKVTTPDGTLYYFGYYPGGGGHAPGGAGVTALQSLSVPGTDTHYDTWFLNRIESFDFKHKIDFEYANSFYRYKVNEECFITKYWLNGSQTGTDNCDGDQFFVTVFGRVLDKITTTTEEITFTHATRDDLEDHNNTNLPKRITRVNVNNGNYCFYYDLSQSYFTSNTGSGNLDKRLKLNSVQKKSCDNSINEEPFTFSYYGGSFFPSLTSKAVDHWGYYNGKTTNNSLDDLIPASSVVTPANNKTLYYGSADRETVESAMLNGALKRITFPTKGYTEYSYEANEYLETNNNNQQLFWAETCTSYGGYCCGNRSNTKYQVLDQAMIDNGVLELVVQHDGQNINC